MSEQFNFDKTLAALQSGQGLAGKDGIHSPLIKQTTEATLMVEQESQLEAGEAPNRKNASSKKTAKSLFGSFELDTLRDCTGSIEPQLINNHQTHLTDEIERRILSMFWLGVSYKVIASHVAELYGLRVSNATISSVTDKIIPEFKQWQQRPLESHYSFVWLDAIHYKVKVDGCYDSKAVYTLMGLNLDGKKEVLGLYLSDSEAASFWLSVLTDISNRGVEDILIASVDGLKGFPEAINRIFPKTEVQLCIIHQVRSSLKYVAAKNKKAFMADLQPVYKAVSKEAAEIALDELENRWGTQYPIVIKSWRNKWENLSVFFKYPVEIRHVVYTTNAIETIHRQYRKLTKTKEAFPNENSLMKLLYMGVQNASKKWTMPLQDWNLTLSQLSFYFEDRLSRILDT